MAGPTRATSRTALGVAALRAAHRLLDQEPWILDDALAIRLLEPEVRAELSEGAERLRRPTTLALRSHVVLRSRYAEERMEAAAAAGVGQAVLLGAGLDTFAYRQPAWARALRIFEVDHPASQAEKRDRASAAGLVAPSNLISAPVDFERTSLDQGLAQAGFDTAQPTFFSWLGVTMYLTRPAIESVLRFVGHLPAGSRMVLTFAQPDDSKDGGASQLADLAAAHGEPWLTRFTPEELTAALRSAGFSRISILSPEEAFDHYYRNRADGLPPPRRASIATAEV